MSMVDPSAAAPSVNTPYNNDINQVGTSTMNPQMLSPQQRAQMKNYAQQLIPYTNPANTPMGGMGQMATAAMNGLIQNPSLAGTFGNGTPGSNTGAGNILSGLFGGGGAPTQLASAAPADPSSSNILSALFGGGNNQ